MRGHVIGRVAHPGAIRDEQLYVLAPEDDPWRVACNARLDDLRAARNPAGVVPGAG